MSKTTRFITAVTTCAVIALGVARFAEAQGSREHTVPYLRAAIGAIDIDERMTVEGVFAPRIGMREATGRYLRGRGYSRFSIIDPVTGLSFDSMYCEQDSQAFRDLLRETGRRKFRFSGYRGRGENHESAVFVTSVRPLAMTEKESAAEEQGKDKDESDPTYRITLLEAATSNRTVLVNVELGKPYRVPGATLTVEREAPEATQ